MMYKQVNKPKENSFQTNRNEGRAVANSVAQKKDNLKQGAAFVDNRSITTVQRTITNGAKVYQTQKSGIIQMNNYSAFPIMLRKDAALWSAGDKKSGLTSTKVIKTKQGSTGLFRFPMGGDIIDTFIGKNVADEDIDRPEKYEDVKKIDIPVAVSDHNLGAAYGDTEALDEDKIVNGSRPVHFRHADGSHGVDRSNKYTWHHKNTLGKMELIDMNVHGGMWHYGGIAGWTASTHTDDSDDDPSGD